MTAGTGLAALPVARITRSGLPRQAALFMSFLISGGLLIFPRVPVLMVILLLCLLAPGFRLVLRREVAPVLVVFAAILLVSLLRPGELHLESVGVRLANFFAGVALLNLYLGHSRETLAQDLYRILGFMAVQALLTVGLAHTLGFLFTSIEISGTTYQTFLLLLNYHVTIEDAGGLIRPDGFFFEPGVFQIYLNLHLYLALFVFRDFRRTALALAAVLSTQSTTGMAICLLLVAAFVFREFRDSKLRRKILLAIAAPVIAAPLAFVAYGNVMDKFFGEMRGSSWVRTYDLATGINVLAAHPWTGIGFDHERYKEEAARLGYAETQLDPDQLGDRGTTNGVLFMLYSLGLPLSVPFLLGMFRQQFLPNRTLVGLLLFLSFISESIIFTPFFLLLILSGLALPGTRRVRIGPPQQADTR